MYLAFNMWCLWSLGSLAERLFGNWTFLMLYVLSGLGGSICSLLWNPTVISAGASGAIFGVAGGLITFWLLGRLSIPKSVIKRDLNSLLWFVGYNLFHGLTGTGVDNAGHVGGLLAGLLMGTFLHWPLPSRSDRYAGVAPRCGAITRQGSPCRAPAMANGRCWMHGGTRTTLARPRRKARQHIPRLRRYLVYSGVTLLLVIGVNAGKGRLANDPLAKSVEAEILLDIGEVAQAIAAYEAILASSWDWGDYDQEAVESANRINLARAYFHLGVMYDNGRGVPQDDAEAVAWYRKAAEQGDADAQTYLGFMYDKGRGVRQDYDEAVTWYRKAAEQGHATAQTNLGVMYEKGRGVPQDDAEAVAWYRKAAEQGYARAQFSLGVMYDNGRGVPQDDAEAVAWYRKAAEQGNASAWNNLGWLYATAKDPRFRDPAQAVECALKAVALTDEKDPGDLDTLAEAYFVSGERGKAVETIRKAIALEPGNKYYQEQCCPGKVAPTDGKSLPLNVLWSVLPGNDLKSRGRKWPPERSIPTRHNGG